MLRCYEQLFVYTSQTWNTALAEMASLWAEHCHWEHGQPDYDNPPYENIGQNLYITTSTTLNIESGLQVSAATGALIHAT